MIQGTTSDAGKSVLMADTLEAHLDVASIIKILENHYPA